MANGDDPVLPSLGIRTVSSFDDIEEVASEGDPDDAILFNPPTGELETEQFRTEESEELQGLVQDLASARVDAANERERIREEATRRARANVLTTIGAQGLTQALTGQDVGAPQQAQQAQKTLRQAEEARREAEAQAEQTEEIAPLQADVKATEIEQQDKQQALKKAQTRRNRRIEQGMNAASRLSDIAAQNVSGERELAILQQELENRKDIIDKKFENEKKLLGLEQNATTSDQESEIGQTITESLSVIGSAKSQIDNLYEKLETDEGLWSFIWGKSRTVPNDALNEVSNIREVLNRMTTGRGMPSVVEARRKLKENNIWGLLPEEKRKNLDRVVDITQRIGGLSQDAKTGEFADELRNSAPKYQKVQDFSPNQVLDRQTTRSVLGGGDGTSGDQGGTSDASGSTEAAEGAVNMVNRAMRQKGLLSGESTFEDDPDARIDQDMGGTERTTTTETPSGPSAGGRNTAQQRSDRTTDSGGGDSIDADITVSEEELAGLSGVGVPGQSTQAKVENMLEERGFDGDIPQVRIESSDGSRVVAGSDRIVDQADKLRGELNRSRIGETIASGVEAVANAEVKDTTPEEARSILQDQLGIDPNASIDVERLSDERGRLIIDGEPQELEELEIVQTRAENIRGLQQRID